MKRLSPASGSQDSNPAAPPLERRLTLFPATALNMANMIGVGPFSTIPLLMSALGGPQSLLGWLVALAITLPDALIWSELGAALPGSGGTYRWLREGFGAQTWGRLMAFLFIWQFILSGPMEIASGYIGIAQYLDYLWPGMTQPGGGLTWRGGAVVVTLGLLNIVLLYRRISSISKLMITLWVGVMLTVGVILVGGALNFDAHKAFDFPPNPWAFSMGFLLGLGAAARVGIYDFLGYYDICFLGDECRIPDGRSKAIIISLVVVAVIYVGINLSINGVISWREFVPADQHRNRQLHRFDLCRAALGRDGGGMLHVAGGVDGHRLRVRAAAGLLAHPVRRGQRRHLFPGVWAGASARPFPHIALVVIGLLAIAASFCRWGGHRHADRGPDLISSSARLGRSGCCGSTRRTCRALPRMVLPLPLLVAA